MSGASGVRQNQMAGVLIEIAAATDAKLQEGLLNKNLDPSVLAAMKAEIAKRAAAKSPAPAAAPAGPTVPGGPAVRGQAYDMMKDSPLEIFLAISLFTGFVFYKTGSFPAVVLVIIVLSAGAYFMGLWVGVPTTFPIQFAYDAVPEPAPSIKQEPAHTAHTPEVFYVAENKYSYADAANVCAAYDAKLATHDQLVDAYAKGAEWCGYGWTDGGMALYPTQDSTWKTLQQAEDITKRKSCGVPGVNGGYFDLKTKFGVNCFGIKPDGGNQQYPISVNYGEDDAAAKATKAAIAKFKEGIKDIKILPFNRSGWSEWNA